MLPEPAAIDCEVEARTVFRRAAGVLKQKRSVEQFNVNAVSWAASVALAICSSLRAALSGSADGRVSSYFIVAVCPTASS